MVFRLPLGPSDSEQVRADVDLELEYHWIGEDREVFPFARIVSSDMC